MTRREKLLQRISNNPKDVSPDELHQLLTHFGFVQRKSGGGSSHRNYTKDGCPYVLTVPFKKPLKAVYVIKALQFIEEYGNPDE